MKFIPDVSNFVANNKKRNAEPKYAMHSLELVITVVLFAVAGRFLDTRFSTTPILTLLLTLFAALGAGATAYLRYQQASQVLDEGKAWSGEKSKVAAPVVEEEKDELVIPQGYGSDDE